MNLFSDYILKIIDVYVASDSVLTPDFRAKFLATSILTTHICESFNVGLNALLFCIQVFIFVLIHYKKPNWIRVFKWEVKK